MKILGKFFFGLSKDWPEKDFVFKRVLDLENFILENVHDSRKLFILFLLVFSNIRLINPLSPGVLDPGNYPAGVLRTHSCILALWAFLSPLVSMLNHI